MKSILFTVLLSVLIFSGCNFSLTSCTRGSGTTVSKEIEVAAFNAVILKTSGNVSITQDSIESLIIETDDNVFTELISEVKNGKLYLSSKSSISPTKLNYKISMKNIQGLRIDGSGQISLTSPVNTSGTFHLYVGGSGNIKLKEVFASKVDSEVSGSGSIFMSGKASEADYEINGSGDINAIDLETLNTEVEINGSGNCYVDAKENLDIEINGSGDVYFKQRPTKDYSSSINGSGRIKEYKKWFLRQNW